MTIKIPDRVEYIINTLNKNGYEAYAVGGCVRDSVLGRIPEDWDITTSAKPEEVKKIFRRTIDTGIMHGTVTVMLEKEGYEVTTYRIDGEYEDNRHPKNVEFTTNLIEDLKRRDFTINAMAYNQDEGLIDAFNGMKDIECKRICCVGNAKDRFDEDALRMLRAVRFAGQLGFAIEEHTKDAIIEKASNLVSISAERIRVELNKLITSKGPDRIRDAYYTGMTKIVLPEFDLMMETDQNNPHHCYSVGEHSIKALMILTELCNQKDDEYSRVRSVLAWSVLLHDVGKPIAKTTDAQGIDHFYGHADKSAELAKKILRRLKFDNYSVDIVSRLIKWHDFRFKLTPSSLRRAINRIGEDIIELLFIVKRADVLAQSLYKQEEKLMEIDNARCIYQEVMETKACLSLKTLAINGQDLINIGVSPGKEIGIILNQLLERVLEEPELNEKEILLLLAKEMKV